MLSRMMKLYKYFPVWLQNIGISLYGFQLQRKRYGGIFEEELEKFKAREGFSAEQWHEYQTMKLRHLLKHAFETVPFYNEKYKKAGFTLSDFETFELSDLKKLPILEKDELRRYGRSTLLSSLRKKQGDFLASSGSTGTPTSIYYSLDMHQRLSAAYEARVRHWAGVSRYDSRGMIGGKRVVPEGDGRPPYYRYNFVEKQLYMSAYHISPKTIDNYLEGIKKYNIDYLTGYAKSNYFLARFLKERGIKVKGIKSIVVSSEKLTQEMREVFSEVYGCKTFDGYSGVEACGLVSETEHGQLLISPDVGITEICDVNFNDVAKGESGEAIFTGLLNFDQPLIRYRIGDVLKLSAEQSTLCGRQMPVVDEIVGRMEDTVVGKDGREIVRFHGIFVDIKNLIEGQIIQNDYDSFTLKVIVQNHLTNEEKALLTKRMVSQLGRIDLEIIEVENIPRNKNGKFQAVISNIKRIQR